MRFTHSFLFRVIITASLLLGFPIHGAFAVSYPVTTPAGEQAGGWFQTYFDNMYTAPCGVNQFLNGFTISGVLLCSTPGIYVAGVLGQTLYYDGTDWVATSNIWNDNTNVGIGTAVPGAKLDVNGDALINSLILGRGSGSIASNTAFGYQTFFSNVTGINNVGIGYQTLYSNASGFGNSALGYRALRNTLGDNNTAVGFESLYTNVTGVNNTAYGANSLYLNSIGSYNTALGYGALSSLTSGDYNIAIGNNAEVPSDTGSGQLSIGNWIYGSGGIIGIGTGSLNTAAKLKIAGQVEITGGNPGAGKVLTSDANGLASWTGLVTATSLSLSGSATGSTIYFDGTNWIPNVNIYNLGGNVGIGTNLPGAKLEVNGQVKITGGSVSSGRILTTDATGLAYWADPGVASSVTASGITGGASGYLSVFGTGGNGLYPSLLFQSGTRMGIGTMNPSAELDIVGQIKISGGTPGIGKVLTSDATGLASWGNPAIATSVYATGVLAAYGSGGYITQFMPYGTGITSSIIYQSGSYIGIGNTTPGYNLDVTGTFRNTGNAIVGGTIQILGGTPGVGKVLTSDATGLASWSTVSATTVYATGVIGAYGSGGYLTKFMTNGTGITSAIVFESGSYIGIGNTNPGYNLDVTGTFRNTGNAAIGGNATVAGTLGVTGTANLASTLNVTGVSTLGSTLNVTGASNFSNTLTVGGATSLQSSLSVTGNTLIGGTIQIQGGTPGLGKILMSDANGLATWTTYASGATATGITGGASGYLSVFGAGGNGLYSSLLFQTGTRIGIGNTTPGYTLDVTGTGNFVGLRLPTGASSGYILTSDTSGNMRWMTNNYIETDPQVGANTTNYVSKWDGSALVTSQIFDNGTSVGIGTGVPGTYRLNVNGDTYIGGSITVSGSVITDKIVNRTVSNVSISGSLLPDTAAPMTYRDIGNDTTASWNNLYLSGQIKIKGGTPGLGKILMSDANGLATWTTYASGATATGITGGASGYLSVFGAGGNGLYSSLLFQTGTRIGIGNTTPGYTLDVTGTGNFVGLRLPTGASNNYILTSDASGNARWSALASSSNTVYATGVIGAYGSGGYFTKFMTNGTGITSALLFETGGRIGLGTTVPQYMFDMRGSGSILNAGSGLCIDGVCINAWSGLNNLVRSTGTPDYIAKFNSGGVIDNSQIYETGGNLYIGDISGIISGSATIGYITIEAAGSTNSANPFLTLSENGGQECRMWITGANKLGSNCSWTAGLGGSYEPNQIIRADSAGTELTGSTLYQVGNFFGFGNSAPTSRFEVWTGSSVSPLQHFRGVQNVGLGQNGLNPAVSGSRNVGIGTYALSGVTSGSRNIGIGSLAGSNITTGSNNIMIGSGVQIANAAWSDQLSIGNWIYGSGGKIGIGTGSLSTNAILKIAGQVEITGGTPGLGKILTSDANGLATWTTYASGVTATGVVGGTQNYLPKFGAGGAGLYISQIIDTGTGIGIGATGGTINTKFVIDSGVDDDSGLRLSRLDINTPLTSNGVLALGINSSGKVLPISPISNIAVYTGVLRTTALSPNPDLNTFDITYNFNQYFAIPGKQSFVVSKGDGPSYNGPYFKENGTSALCSITGTYGTSPYDCIDPDPVTGLSASPYNSFTMTAKGDTFGYQLALGARGDAPLFARSGRFNGSQTGGLYTNDSPYQTPAPWQRVLSLPANHPEYLYINTGLNSQLQSQTGAGNIGIGTTVPNSRFEVWTGATTQTLFHFRGLENVGIGLNSLNITLTGRRNVALGVNGLDVVTSGSYNVAIGSNAGNTLTTGSNNIMIGSGANVVNTGSNQLNIGNWIYGSGGFISVGRTDPQSNFEVWSGGTSTIIHFRGTDNVGFGLNAARYQASGTANSAFGDDALRTDTTGYSNTALGASSLYSNQTGFFNTAGGTQSLYTNQDGTWNVALGSQALFTNLSGDYNVSLGGQSLYLNSTGDNSVAIGYQALRATTNGYNIGIGNMAGSGITTGTGNIMIGNNVQANSNTANNQLNIGNWIYGSGGYIGIGIATPGAKLEVNGQIKITGGSPGAGKVLTSDASGLATWQTPSGSGGGGGGVTGGQSNYTARWLDATTLGTGALTDDGTNVGIGTASPGSKLGVNGTFRLGTNGTQLNAIIKATVNKDFPNIANNSCSAQTFAVTNAQTGGSVIVSPASAINDGLMITYARVSAASTVEVKICNESGASVNLSAMNFYITVIQ